MDTKDKEITVVAGRGVIYITIAKIYFMITGWIITFVLPRLMSSRFIGAYELVIGTISILDNSIVTGTIQTVSKFTSERGELSKFIKRKSLKIQFIIGLIISLLFMLLAYPIATYVLKSQSLFPYMELSSVVIFSYSIYSTLIGSLNGEKRFHLQASLDVTYSSLKMLGIIGLAWLGFKVWGGVGGFVSATLIILVIALVVVGIGEEEKNSTIRVLPTKRYLNFWFPLFFYTLITNFIMRVDLYILQAITARIARGEGLTIKGAELLSNTLSAYYAYAQKLAFIPYQLILSITFVAFPLVSSATFQGDIEKAKDYIKTALRFSFLMVVGGALVFAANPIEVISVVLPTEYTQAGVALKILAIGIVFFSMMTVSISILNSSGFVYRAVILGIITLLSSSVINVILVYVGGASIKAIKLVALGSTLAMLLGATLSQREIYRLFNVTLPLPSILRGVISFCICYFVGSLIPSHTKLQTLGESIFVFLLYFVVLFVTGEVKREERKLLLKIILRS